MRRNPALWLDLLMPPAFSQPLLCAVFTVCPAITLSSSVAGNPSLCGTSGLPACPSFTAPPPPLSAVPLSSSASGSGGLSGGAVAGLVLGIVALLVLLAAGGYWAWRRWGRGRWGTDNFPDHVSGTSELVQHSKWVGLQDCCTTVQCHLCMVCIQLPHTVVH